MLKHNLHFDRPVTPNSYFGNASGGDSEVPVIIYNPVMDHSDMSFNSMSQTLMNPPPYNDYNTSYEYTSINYPKPQSPSNSHTNSHFHSDSESIDVLPTTSSKSTSSISTSTSTTTPNPQKRKSSSRKSTQPQSQILKRRVQNRAAQRSFRERQKEYVHDLEQQVEVLKDEVGRLNENYRGLLKVVAGQSRMSVPMQGWGGLSPAVSVDEFGGEVGDEEGMFESVKSEGALWPSSLEDQRIFY